MKLTAPLPELSFDLQAAGRRLRIKAILPPGQTLDGPQPVLVFLHEGLGSIAQWRDFPLALARTTGLPALVYDRYGHGRSEALQAPRDRNYLETECEALAQVLDTCAIQAPILIGHSDGATLALLFAARFPQRALGVVAEAAHVFIEAVSLQGIREVRRAFETTALRAQLARHHGAKVDSLFYGWNDVWLAPEHQDWSMLDRLAAIRVPVLAIQGALDEYGTPAQLQAITGHAGGPARALLLSGCGHVPHFQAREAVLAELTGFVAELRRRPGGTEITHESRPFSVENEISSP